MIPVQASQIYQVR